MESMTEGLNDKYAALMNKYVASLGENATPSKIQNAYKYYYTAQVEEEREKQEAEVGRELTRKSVDAKDQKTANICNNQVNTKILANSIRKKVKSDGYDFSKVNDCDVVSWYLKSNPSKQSEIEAVSSGEADMDTFLISAGLEKKPTVSGDSTFGTALGVAGGIGAGTAALGTAALGSDTAGKLGDWLYRQNINQHSRDANIIVKRESMKDKIANADEQLEKIGDGVQARQQSTLHQYYQDKINELETSIEKSTDKNEKRRLKRELKTTQESYNDFLKEADSQITAEGKIKDKAYYEQIKGDAKAKLDYYENTPLTRETAYKYGIHGSTNKEIATKADKVQQRIWDNEIGRYINKSNSQIDMKKIIDNIDINNLSELEGDRDKLQGALDIIKEEYKNSDYGKLSVSKAQDIKNGLYNKMPASAWKGKDITNQYKKILNEVSQGLRQEIEDKLSSEFGGDFGTKYREWGNIKELATDEKRLLEGKGAVGGKLSVASTIVEGVTTPLFSEGGYYLKKANEAIKGAKNKVVKGAKDLLKTAKENPVQAAKTVGKGVKNVGKALTSEMPAAMIFDKFTEDLKYDMERKEGKEARGFNLIPESKWTEYFTKEQVVDFLKDEDFREYADHLNINLNKLIDKFGIKGKELDEVNTAINNQKKANTESKAKEIQGSTVEGKLKQELEKSDKTNPLLKRTQQLKNQKATISTKKKSSK